MQLESIVVLMMVISVFAIFALTMAYGNFPSNRRIKD